VETTREAGARFEDKAAEYLREHNYVILERNFRAKVGELDIVARDGDTVVFVEVRARACTSFGGAAQTVGSLKRRKLIKTALVYTQRMRLDCPMRFDVIAFDEGRLEHIADAFQAY
jgi:putative endonuclease